MKEDVLEFAQRLDMAILGLTNYSQPPTDAANCLTLQNALDNGDKELMFLRISIRIISRPAYAKYIKALKDFHMSTSIIKFGNQKKQSEDLISFTYQVPMYDYCHKYGYLVQACRTKVAAQKIVLRNMEAKVATTLEEAKMNE
jgi:hypothetical protein